MQKQRAKWLVTMGMSIIFSLFFLVSIQQKAQAELETIEWTSLGGQLKGDPKAIFWGDGYLSVVARSATDNALSINTLFNGSWVGWYSLGGETVGSPSVVSLAENTLTIFARGKDNDVLVTLFDGSWSKWISLGGQTKGDYLDVVSWGPNHWAVFALDTENHLTVKSFSDGKLSEWEPIGDRTFAKGPSVVSWGEGHISVVAQDNITAAGLSVNTYSEGSWGEWKSLDNGSMYYPQAYSIVSWGEGHLAVIAKDLSNTLWVTHFNNNNGSWSKWESLGKLGTSDGQVYGTPSVFSPGPNSIIIFAKGTDQVPYLSVYADGKWSEWVSVGGLLNGGSPEFVWTPTHSALFGRRVDNAIWCKRWITPIDKPDLVVESLTMNPSNPYYSDKITFTAKIKNIGSITAVSTKVKLAIGQESNPTEHVVPSLAPAETYTINRANVQLNAGDYRITATGDVYNIVDEVNESNNAKFLDLTVIQDEKGGSWEPIGGQEDNMIVDGVAYVGQELAAVSDLIGAFGPGGETDCRAVDKIDEHGEYYLTVGGNTPGERITFKILRSANEQILDSLEDVSFDPKNNQEDKTLHFNFYTQQEIELVTGWNWVSFHVLPDDTSLEAIFGESIDLVEEIKTQTESTFYKQGRGWVGNYSLMSNIAKGVMFKIKVKEGFTLKVNGKGLDLGLPITLAKGWTWLAYLPPSCASVEGVIASVKDDLSMIKSQTQSKTNKSGTLRGDLDEMCPGKGYVVNMLEKRIFTYNP